MTFCHINLNGIKNVLPSERNLILQIMKKNEIPLYSFLDCAFSRNDEKRRQKIKNLFVEKDQSVFLQWYVKLKNALKDYFQSDFDGSILEEATNFLNDKQTNDNSDRRKAEIKKSIETLADIQTINLKGEFTNYKFQEASDDQKLCIIKGVRIRISRYLIFQKSFGTGYESGALILLVRKTPMQIQRISLMLSLICYSLNHYGIKVKPTNMMLFDVFNNKYHKIINYNKDITTIKALIDDITSSQFAA